MQLINKPSQYIPILIGVLILHLLVSLLLALKKPLTIKPLKKNAPIEVRFVQPQVDVAKVKPAIIEKVAEIKPKKIEKKVTPVKKKEPEVKPKPLPKTKVETKPKVEPKKVVPKPSVISTDTSSLDKQREIELQRKIEREQEKAREEQKRIEKEQLEKQRAEQEKAKAEQERLAREQAKQEAEAKRQADQIAQAQKKAGQTIEASFRNKAALSYPKKEQRRGREGSVTFRFVIGKNGKAKNINVVNSTSKAFEKAAKKSLTDSTFTVTKINGVVYEQNATTTFIFQLN